MIEVLANPRVIIILVYDIYLMYIIHKLYILILYKVICQLYLNNTRK